MRKSVVFGVVATVGLLWGLIYGTLWQVEDYNAKKDVIASRVYEGREYLTQDEYSEFKRVLAERDDLDVREIEALTSPDPLVLFEIKVIGDATFPYGEETDRGYGSEVGDVVLRLFCIWTFGVVLIVYCWIPYFRSRSGGERSDLT